MRRKSAGAAGLEAGLTSLDELDLESLRARWQALTGRTAPPTFRTPLLRGAVAYKLQERVHGGLKPSTRRLLHRVAQAAERHAPGPEHGTTAGTLASPTLAGPHGRGPSQASNLGPTTLRSASGKASASEPASASASAGQVVGPQATSGAAPRRRMPRAPVRIKPGTRLLRTWQGSTHEVLVGETGVTYRGQPYRSLSEVARLITGQRWSGPLFFGLKRRASPDLEPNPRLTPERGRGRPDHG